MALTLASWIIAPTSKVKGWTFYLVLVVLIPFDFVLNFSFFSLVFASLTRLTVVLAANLNVYSTAGYMHSKVKWTQKLCFVQFVLWWWLGLWLLETCTTLQWVKPAVKSVLVLDHERQHNPNHYRVYYFSSVILMDLCLFLCGIILCEDLCAGIWTIT